jgi:arylsulfatase A-like enzyme
LLDLAPSAESQWPGTGARTLPDALRGPQGLPRRARELKVGRVDMFPPGGGDSRLALVALSGTSHRFSLRLPADPVLRVGLGYLPQEEVEDARVRFVVDVAAGEGSDQPMDRVVTARSDGGWIDLEVDLSAWAGRDVELSLRTIREESTPRVWAAWSAPEILSRKSSQSGPDVILISLDTLRADRLGCYGYAVDTSPNLDRLAERGIRFEHAVSQAPWTAPSHRALFSGLYPTSRDHEESPALAQQLRDAGFRTEAFTGGGQIDFRRGFAPGFEIYRVYDWIRNLPELENWLARSSRRRRFLFLHTYEIHDPYVHADLVGDKASGRLNGRFDNQRWWSLRGKLSPEERDYIGGLYDGGIAYTDRQLGSLFETLEASGALERSIVIVTSDHGEQFWEHGAWRHGMNLYDEQIMVPLIVHLPESLKKSLASRRRLSGRVFDQQVRLIDVLPTILDLVGVPLAHPVNGRSLAPLLRGEELPPVDAFSERLNVKHRESKALRTERYKFIYSFPKGKGVRKGRKESRELYDLARDPAEQTNLADRYPDEVAQFDARLDTLLGMLTETADFDVDAADLDPDLEERLRALGYLD